jgi:hypothetical protein
MVLHIRFPPLTSLGGKGQKILRIRKIRKNFFTPLSLNSFLLDCTGTCLFRQSHTRSCVVRSFRSCFSANDVSSLGRHPSLEIRSSIKVNCCHCHRLVRIFFSATTSSASSRAPSDHQLPTFALCWSHTRWSIPFPRFPVAHSLLRSARGISAE